MLEQGKLKIRENWGDRFLVALMDNKVLGTISYKETNTVEFNGVDRGPCLEIFSLSVSSEARGLGVAKKLCQHVEDLARAKKINLYLS